MDDLISRQAAINALIQRRKPINNGDGTCTITPLTDAVIREVLNDLPSAEPVRCKDCKWKYNHICTRAVELFIDDNDFCSWAERRTEGGGRVNGSQA